MEKIECPHCGGQAEFVKEWEIKGRVQGKQLTGFHPTKRNVVLIRLFKCLKCGKLIRKGIPQKE